MSLNIELPSEFEPGLAQLASAAGTDVQSFVRTVLAGHLARTKAATATPSTTGSFAERLDAIIARHGIRCGSFDDSRESIYAGRGE